MENSDTPGVRGEPGGHLASGRGRDSPTHIFLLLMQLETAATIMEGLSVRYLQGHRWPSA